MSAVITGLELTPTPMTTTVISHLATVTDTATTVHITHQDQAIAQDGTHHLTMTAITHTVKAITLGIKCIQN